MQTPPNARRIARLQAECDVSFVPALLLALGCAALMLGLPQGLQARSASHRNPPGART